MKQSPEIPSQRIHVITATNGPPASSSSPYDKRKTFQLEEIDDDSN